MNEHETTVFDGWFDEFSRKKEYKEFLAEPVAYFCAEYALFNHSPLYAGGLGILSGDYINEMIDQKLPCVALGLFYYHEHVYGKANSSAIVTPDKLGLELIRNEAEEPRIVTVPIGEREVKIQAWQWKQGAVTLILLDTHVEGNHIDDMTITDTLYVENRDMRLKQEMVLGIGGMRFLKALGIHPSVYHLNEGHSAFLAFELIRHEMKHRQVDFLKACQYARQHIVFTNHTLVAAGHELFSLEAVKSMAHNFAQELGINVEQLIALGVEANSTLFSMTVLALNLSYKVNAVSKLHGQKAAELWKNYSVEEVTNGVYLSRWDITHDGSPEAFWKAHQENKRNLLKTIKEKTGQMFDENTLLLGWGRRLVEYKQPLAILGDVARFKQLAEAEGRQLKLVFSGPLNESYAGENKFIQQLQTLIHGELKGSVVFLPNYDMELSHLLVAGCDIWLNTPIVGTEACGTSGMKACLNGTLPVTTNDGWIAETNLDEIGWVVNDQDITKNLLDVIETEVVPMYYQNVESQKNGQFETSWTIRMEKSRTMILNNFTTARALKEYIEKFYVPTLVHKKHAQM
ncbi:MAG: hypothetical protein RL094_260 [Candidatus Parcubacteria bacterium]|jgi:glucan phosphorylase